MKLSTRGRYGARLMIELAVHYGKGLVLLKDLARRQRLSAKYLDQVMLTLRRAGLVSSKRGVKGGFQLARPPEEIHLLEVVEAVEGPMELVKCVANPEGCPRSKKCVTLEVWEEVGNEIRRVLSRLTLAELARRQREMEGEDPHEDS